MQKNKKIVFIVVGIIVLIGVFYAGMTYGGNNVKAAINSRTNPFSGQGGANGGMMRGNRNGGGFTAGEIISKDANSITVKILNNDPTATTTGSGSKIIFIDPSTTVSKMASGSLTDLTTGTQVSVTGTPNPDGSVTAKSVQIRPQIKPNNQ